MTFINSIKTCYKKYFTFSGRASRSEFWWWQLYLLITYLVIVAIMSVFGFLVMSYTWNPHHYVGLLIPWIINIICLSLLLPTLAVSIRRLHDSNKSGWWFFLGFIPIVGQIILLVFYLKKSDEGENDYGILEK